MTVNSIIWKQKIIDKLATKHRVFVEEVEEVFGSKPLIIKVEKGYVQGENVYAYAHVSNGRNLIVFFINKRGNRALPVSARDMDDSERKYYERQR